MINFPIISHINFASHAQASTNLIYDHDRMKSPYQFRNSVVSSSLLTTYVVQGKVLFHFFCLSVYWDWMSGPKSQRDQVQGGPPPNRYNKDGGGSWLVFSYNVNSNLSCVHSYLLRIKTKICKILHLKFSFQIFGTTTLMNFIFKIQQMPCMHWACGQNKTRRTTWNSSEIHTFIN